MATIGNLSVKVSADTDGLATGLKSAESKIGNFSAKIDGLLGNLKVVGPAAAAAGAALAYGMVKSVADVADALGDLSERTGVAVEDLSRLQYVAQLSGSSAEAMNAAIIRLSQGIANGNPAFEAMGVAVKNADGSLRSQSDVLKDVADKFATYRDGTAKTALAMQLFGKSGAEMVGVLNQGSAGIKELSDESDRLGNTISTKTAKEAARFNDNLDKMSVAAGGIARTVSGPLIEALADLTGGLFEAYMQGETLFGSFERGFKRMAQAKDINTAKERVNELQIEYDKMMASMAHLEPWEQASMGAMTLAQRLGEAKARYAELTQLSENFRGQGFQDPRAVGTVPDEKGNAPDVAASEAAKKAAEERAKQRADELAQIRQNELDKAQAFIDALTMKRDARIEANLTDAEIEQERYTLEQEKLLEALELGLITKGEYQVLEQEQLMAHREAMAGIESQYLTDQLARERAAADERVRIQDAAEQMIRNARAATFSDAANLLTMLGGKSKAAAIAAIALNKGLAIAQIIQNTAVAQMRAMAELGPIAGPPAAAKIGVMGKIQAGIAAATGLAQIAGLGGGSSSAVTSGGVTASGSVGSSSTAQNQQMMMAPKQNQTITIQLQGEIFGREQVRTLITEINDAVADGAVLRLA